jgi:flagellar export protein FliJ
MPSRARLSRLCRLRTRLREQAAAELERCAARVTAIDRELGALRVAEDAARLRAAQEGGSGAALVLAWAYADDLARRASALVDDRARAMTSAEGARDTLRERWRQEEQLARLAARLTARADEAVAREHARTLDELAIRSHGRTS